MFWRKFLLEIPGGAVSLSIQGLGVLEEVLTFLLEISTRYLDGMTRIGFGPRPTVTCLPTFIMSKFDEKKEN